MNAINSELVIMLPNINRLENPAFMERAILELNQPVVKPNEKEPNIKDSANGNYGVFNMVIVQN